MELKDEQGYQWEAKQEFAPEVKLNDTMSGQKIVVRMFEFGLPPITPESFPSDEEFIRVHKDNLEKILWNDELVPLQKDWRVVFSDDKRKATVYIACQPKVGSGILEQAGRV